MIHWAVDVPCHDRGVVSLDLIPHHCLAVAVARAALLVLADSLLGGQ
jgi:hypothetical protein